MMRIVTQFVLLRNTLLRPRTLDALDFGIVLTKRAIMMIFWLLDCMSLLQKIGILRCRYSSIIQPKMCLYLVDLFLTFFTQMKKHFWARKTVLEREASIAQQETRRRSSFTDETRRRVSTGENNTMAMLIKAYSSSNENTGSSEGIALTERDPAILAARRRGLRATFGMAKVVCDMVSAANSSGLCELLLSTSINEAAVNFSSVASAVLALCMLVSK